MPVLYSIDAENRLVRTNFTGVVTNNDVLEHTKQLREEPAFDPRLSELVDLTEAEEVRLTYADFESLEGVDPFSQEAKRAFVVPTGTHIFALTRMFQGMRGQSAKINIFSNVPDALAWLNE
jgi:hypothetical protein